MLSGAHCIYFNINGEVMKWTCVLWNISHFCSAISADLIDIRQD